METWLCTSQPPPSLLYEQSFRVNSVSKEPSRFPSFRLPNDVIDNNGVWMLQQSSQLHGNLRETESATAEDLERASKAW